MSFSRDKKYRRSSVYACTLEEVLKSCCLVKRIQGVYGRSSVSTREKQHRRFFIADGGQKNIDEVILAGSSKKAEAASGQRIQPFRAVKTQNRGGGIRVQARSGNYKKMNKDEISAFQARFEQIANELEAIKAENQRLKEQQLALTAPRSRESTPATQNSRPDAQQPRILLRDAMESLPKFRGDDPAKPVQKWTRVLENKDVF